MFRTIARSIAQGLRATFRPAEEQTNSVAQGREIVIYWATHFDYTEDSDTFKKALEYFNNMSSRVVINDETVESWFNPASSKFVAPYIESASRGIKVMAMAHTSGRELISRIVGAWVGDLSRVSSVKVGSHETMFLNSEGRVIVAFYGSGRKMHHGDSFRVSNAQVALNMLGIDASIEEIAQLDMQTAYAPLLFERSSTDGAWVSRELEAVGG